MTAIDSRVGTHRYATTTTEAGPAAAAGDAGDASQLVNGEYRLNAKQLEYINTQSAKRGDGGWALKEPFIGRVKNRVTEGMEAFLKANPKATPEEIQKQYDLVVQKAGSIESGLLRGIENQMRRICAQFSTFIQDAAKIWD